MSPTVYIPHRFRGPPDSGNGGYSCGAVAQHIEGPAEVMLRKPPPLDTELSVVPGEDGLIEVYDGDQLVAIGKPAVVDVDVPDPVSFSEAQAAAARFRFRDDGHLIPSCFTCGPDRAPGDGLNLFSEAVPGTNIAAAAWVPDPSVCDDGLVHTPVVWAVLDCPSYFGIVSFDESPPPYALLGTFAARIDHLPQQGEHIVTMGWELGRDGRKLFSASALWSEERGLLAVAKATWIVLKR